VLFLGHIAISLLLADATRSDGTAAVAGNLVPDVVDKSGAWILRAMPSARWLGHGLPFSLAIIIGARLFLDEQRWRGFALGYAAHLAADLWNGGKVPWLAPFGPPPVREKETQGLRGAVIYLLPELVGAALILRRLSKAKPSVRLSVSR
jgi:membrane-bound metal-dependent hydrolase YbcI (DUF457 family)